MKDEARVIGVDDAPFSWNDATVPIVGVVMRGPRYVEGFLRSDVTVDGDDATDRIATMIRESRFAPTARAVLLDGVTFGGFNVVDLPRLSHALELPVVAVTRGVPDVEAMTLALRAHVPDPEPRIARLHALAPLIVPTESTPLALGLAGIAPADAIALVTRLTVRGLTPEPLRLAHQAGAGLFGRERGARGGRTVGGAEGPPG